MLWCNNDGVNSTYSVDSCLLPELHVLMYVDYIHVVSTNHSRYQ